MTHFSFLSFLFTIIISERMRERNVCVISFGDRFFCEVNESKKFDSWPLLTLCSKLICHVSFHFYLLRDISFTKLSRVLLCLKIFFLNLNKISIYQQFFFLSVKTTVKPWEDLTTCFPSKAFPIIAHHRSIILTLKFA